MISSKQVKAARILLGWKGEDLAKNSGVGIATLRRYESQDGLLKGNNVLIKAIKDCLEEANIVFTGDPETNPGVAIKKS